MSDQDNTLFDDSTSAPASAASLSLDNLPEVASLVGEGKKYKTLEDALRSVPHAQSHIQELEGTLENLREELNKRITLEEAVSELRAGTQRIDPPVGDSNQSVGAANEEDVAKIVEKIVAGRETKLVQQANQKKVVETLRAVFGDKTKEVYDAKVAALGMSHEDFTTLATNSPQAALALFPEAGAATRSMSGNTSNGSVRTEGFSQSGVVKPGTYKWYSQLRKENPRHYFSREVQVEMARKAAELGPSFYE